MTPADLRAFCQTVLACADAFASNRRNGDVLALHRRACSYARQQMAELARSEEDAPTMVISSPELSRGERGL